MRYRGRHRIPAQRPERRHGMSRHPYEWEPLEAAQVVALDPDTYRAGRAVLERAPVHILEAWQGEELSTAEAYRLTLAWEAGEPGPTGGRP